tara:strand:+ start:817 stop:1575 length:759 start_codon:yes stop_codon:yes gene_type:complete
LSLAVALAVGSTTVFKTLHASPGAAALAVFVTTIRPPFRLAAIQSQSEQAVRVPLRPKELTAMIPLVCRIRPAAAAQAVLGTHTAANKQAALEAAAADLAETRAQGLATPAAIRPSKATQAATEVPLIIWEQGAAELRKLGNWRLILTLALAAQAVNGRLAQATITQAAAAAAHIAALTSTAEQAVQAAAAQVQATQPQATGTPEQPTPGAAAALAARTATPTLAAALAAQECLSSVTPTSFRRLQWRTLLN